MHNVLGARRKEVLAIWLLGWLVVEVHGQPPDSWDPLVVDCETVGSEKQISTETTITTADIPEQEWATPNLTSIPFSNRAKLIIVRLQRCNWTTVQDITITTCDGSDFNTVLLQLSGNPYRSNQDLTVTSFNRFDATCAPSDFKRATLKYRVDSNDDDDDDNDKNLHFVLAGFEDETGTAIVRIQSEIATAPQAAWGLWRVDQRT